MKHIENFENFLLKNKIKSVLSFDEYLLTESQYKSYRFEMIKDSITNWIKKSISKFKLYPIYDNKWSFRFEANQVVTNIELISLIGACNLYGYYPSRISYDNYDGRFSNDLLKNITTINNLEIYFFSYKPEPLNNNL